MKQWQIKNPDGKLVKGTVCDTKGDAWSHARYHDIEAKLFFDNSNNYMRYREALIGAGYTVVRVNVTEVKL